MEDLGEIPAEVQETLSTNHIVTIPIDAEEEDADVMFDVSFLQVHLVHAGESIEVNEETVMRLFQALLARERLRRSGVKVEHPPGACETCNMDENGMYIFETED